MTRTSMRQRFGFPMGLLGLVGASLAFTLTPMGAGGHAQTPDPSVQLVSRVKDLARIENADHNVLKGLGLVTGLNGTGDSPKGLSQRLMANLIANLDSVKITQNDINSKNVAVVSVSAMLPPFQGRSTRIDVRVSSFGDAKSLKGGDLVITPLRSPGPLADDPKVYAVAQGSVYIGGDTPTVGYIPGGAEVQEDVVHHFLQDRMGPGGEVWSTFTLVLNRPDFNVCMAVVVAIARDPILNDLLSRNPAMPVARVLDAGHVLVRVPMVKDSKTGDLRPREAMPFVAQVMATNVYLSQEEAPVGRVVVNQTAGTITITGNVTVYPGYVNSGTFKLLIPRPAAGAPGTPPASASRGVPLHRILQDMLPGGVAAGPLPKDVLQGVIELHRAGLINAELVVN